MIVVVGAGITGLAIGHELDALGLDFIILESDRAPGGVIRSGEVEGRVLDWGPQRIRLTPALSRLVEQLRIEDQLLTAPAGLDLFVYRQGRLHPVPRSPGGLLGSRLLSPAAKLRLALEPLTAGADPAERVSEYFARKLGREAYEAVAGPLFGGLYGSDPAEMEVGIALTPILKALGIERSLLRPLIGPRRAKSPPAATFRGGMQTLPIALAGVLGGRVRLGATATAVRAAEGRVQVAVATGANGTGGTVDTLDCRAVVITSPADVTARLLARSAPAVASAVGSLHYNTIAVVHLASEAGLSGFGFQVALSEPDLVLRGVTFNHSLFGRRNLYTAYLGGALHPEVSGQEETELGERACRDFRHCTGQDSAVLAVRKVRMPAWDLSWRAIRGIASPPGVHFAGNWWSRPGLPGRLQEARRVARALARGGGAAA